MWGRWPPAESTVCLEGQPRSALFIAAMWGCWISFPNLWIFFFFSRETRDSGFYLQSPGVYNLAANKFSCFFFNANQMQCHPMGCQFKISDLAHLLFFSGQPSPGKVRWLVMWLETCSLVPRPCPPNKAWSSVSNLSRIGKNNKNLNLSKATLKVNWISPPAGFHFLFKSFRCDGIRENWAWIPALLWYSVMILSKLLASHLCPVPSTFFFLFFLLFLFSSSTAWWLKAHSLEPDMYLGFSTYYLCDLGQVTQVFYASVSSSVAVQSLSHVRLFATSWTVACQAFLSFTISQSWLKLMTTESWWWHPTISPSVVPVSSPLQSFLASGSFPMSQLFPSGGQSIGASASASVLPMNIQGWFPLGLTGLILLSKGLSRVFSSSVKWNNNSTYLRGTLKNIRTCFTWNIRGTWHLHGAVSLPLPFSFLFPLLLWKPWVFNPEGPALVPHLTVSAFSPLWPSTVSLQPAVWPRSGRCYGSPLIAFSSVPFLELRFWAHLCPFTSLSSYFFCRFRIFGRDETSQLPAIST